MAEIEKCCKWYYEGDKFAPEGYVIPGEIKIKAENIVSELSKINFFEDEKSGDLFQKFRYILDILEKWVFAKRCKDNNASKWVSYFEPKKMIYENLVEIERPDPERTDKIQGNPNHYRSRLGFMLNDFERSERQILNQADYCMYCHLRNKDSCSKGFKDKSGGYKKNPLGNILKGCPLDEKISEFHIMRMQGIPVASLALITIDNPMCPGTGHRICNDCMKSCIFQSQEPVNIPLTETSALKNVLSLPYGFEIYSLLTRWNPLNVIQPYMKSYNGKDVLITGMGPAGYTLAHYLTNEGFGVTGIDELKIEPLFTEYTSYDRVNNTDHLPEPVKDYYKQIWQSLDKRILQGFGGVSEYGITVRWDKNYLSVIYINLMRKRNFRIYDGISLGESFSFDYAWEKGFRHIAICTGAKGNNKIDLGNKVKKGIHLSSDFLMKLQLTGAQKEDSDVDLLVELPAVVIGGGLTSIDCSTELMAYYPVQLKKILKRFNELKHNEDEFWSKYNEEEKEKIKKFILHGKELEEEYYNALAQNRKPDLINLLRKWGGVTLVSRKRMIDTPSYRENHIEIDEALEQGIYIQETLNPVEALPDENENLDKLRFEKLDAKTEDGNTLAQVEYINTGNFIELPARTLIIAAGTHPVNKYENVSFDKRKKFFKPFELSVNGEISLKGSISSTGLFTDYSNNGRYISFYGDNHPYYTGSVVKAMASAKKGYKELTCLINSGNKFEKMNNSNDVLFNEWSSVVVDLERNDNDNFIINIRSSSAANNYKEGDEYIIQPYEVISGNCPADPIISFPEFVDREKGELRFRIKNGKGLSELKVKDKIFLRLKPAL
jgi:NADPH-dependent glutamate synthase beta subunit-like oxidoreductase